MDDDDIDGNDCRKWSIIGLMYQTSTTDITTNSCPWCLVFSRCLRSTSQNLKKSIVKQRARSVTIFRWNLAVDRNRMSVHVEYVMVLINRQ